MCKKQNLKAFKLSWLTLHYPFVSKQVHSTQTIKISYTYLSTPPRPPNASSIEKKKKKKKKTAKVTQSKPKALKPNFSILRRIPLPKWEPSKHTRNL